MVVHALNLIFGLWGLWANRGRKIALLSSKLAWSTKVSGQWKEGRGREGKRENKRESEITSCFLSTARLLPHLFMLGLVSFLDLQLGSGKPAQVLEHISASRDFSSGQLLGLGFMKTKLQSAFLLLRVPETAYKVSLPAPWHPLGFLSQFFSKGFHSTGLCRDRGGARASTPRWELGVGSSV